MKRISRGKVLAGAGAVSPFLDTTVSIIAPALNECGAAGSGTAVNVAMSGAALGDKVEMYPPADLAGLSHSAYVPAAGSITLVLVNTTAGTVTFGTATWGVQVFRRT